MQAQYLYRIESPLPYPPVSIGHEQFAEAQDVVRDAAPLVEYYREKASRIALYTNETFFDCGVYIASYPIPHG